MIKIDGQPVRVVPEEATEDQMRDGAHQVRNFIEQRGPYPRTRAMYAAALAAAPTAPDEVLVEMVRVLRKIEFDWDGEPEDMADARAILARVEVDNA